VTLVAGVIIPAVILEHIHRLLGDNQTGCESYVFK
jgi:hypothetical protein